MIIPLVNTKSCFFFLGNIWWFFFRTSMLIALGDLIPASPETITSDSAAQLTGGDPWIAGLEGFFCLEVFMNPGNTLNFGFQDPEFCVRFCLFIFSSSTIYIYVISRISGFGMVPSMAKKNCSWVQQQKLYYCVIELSPVIQYCLYSNTSILVYWCVTWYTVIITSNKQ